MSDEESFVILGSTPTPSMEAYSSLNDNQKSVGSVRENKSSGRLSGSTNSEESWSKNSNASLGNPGSTKPSIVLEADRIVKDNSEMKSQINGSVWSTSVASESSRQPSMKSHPTRNESSLPETIADKYLLGKIDGNTMKAQVSTMFPSLFGASSHQDDVQKLQQLIIDHETYKSQLVKMNKKLEHLIDIIQVGNERHQQEIEKLRQEKNIMQKEFESEIEIIKIREQMLKKECDSLLMKISDGRSIMNNIGAKLEKLELEQQEMSIININPSPTETVAAQIPAEFVASQKIKELEHKLSEVTAENFEFKDMKKIYIEEIDCLKVNLTAAEELLRQAQDDIKLLKNKELENAKKFGHIDKAEDKMKQEIELLRHQLEVYRADFEMERNARQELAGQKDQLLTDLKLLQRRNQQLIEENEKRFKTSMSTPAQSSSNPSRDSPPKQTLSCFVCPICNKTFSSLPPLEMHVQNCLTA